MDASQLFLLAWAGLIFWELGQIWLVQIVVYPLFAKVSEAEYVGYHRFYASRIPLPVIGPGFAGFLLPVPLAFFGPVVPLWMSAVNVVAGLIGLLVTVLLEIPRHNRLEQYGKNDATIAELTRFSWPRTLSITTSAAVTMAMLLSVFAMP
ncbi:hypothetical protein [Chelativorans sp. AA-79]|uniref:hypothetical protein n=1 Tax=Chelativorans sp. AA-79 TaxID=3028735 RepID=UPI0023F6FA32|nr:hypothetical protein [Chelativorans sp. AA-79]WEX08913.1 hypothetical protein PVE73_23105 [Chelativorans sp. AA-79]